MSNSPRKITVLVVDDSAVVRGMWVRHLAKDPIIEIVGTSSNGDAAVKDVQKHSPDIVLLDIEMPVMDGLQALDQIIKIKPNTRVIMASTLTTNGSRATVAALTKGAVDFVTKPSSTGGKDLEAVAQELIEKIRLLGPAHLSAEPIVSQIKSTSKNRSGIKPRAIVVASSTGGPNALSTFLSGLPTNLQQPIFIVQHMPPVFTALLAERLSREGTRSCVEVTASTVVKSGLVYLAPGGAHLKLAANNSLITLEIDRASPEENFCRPAADVLFRTAAAVFGADIIAVVLTGMGEDGKRGCEIIKATGGVILAQDQSTSVVWGMPGAVVGADLADEIVKIQDMAAMVAKHCL